LRDRTAEFSWADVSPVAADLRERLVSRNLGNATEFDRAVERARRPLEEVARLGGDPRFVIMVLVSARWRKLRTPGRQFRRWIRALELVATDEELHELLKAQDAPRAQLQAAADDAVQFLKRFVSMDEDIMGGMTTLRTEESRRWSSRWVEHALAVIAWHLKHGTRAKPGAVLRILAEFADAFALIRSRGGETPPVEAVQQRLKRIKDDYYTKFAVPTARTSFHDLHRFLAWKSQDAGLARCGSACVPGAISDEPWTDYVPIRRSRPNT
jgi:hypothetical protein